MMVETWYVMNDGTAGDPNEIGTGEDGKLRHKDGREVAYGPHGPRSRGDVDADAERAKAKTRYGVPKKDMKPEEPAVGYKTRELK